LFLWHHISPQVHPITLHGGMFAVDPLSPSNRKRSRVPYVKQEIDLAMEAKGAHGITFEMLLGFTDWKCGIGAMHDTPMQTMLQSAIHAGAYLGEHVIPGMPIEQMVFIDGLQCGHAALCSSNISVLSFVSSEMLKYLGEYQDPEDVLAMTGAELD
jgi:hypothetical protein